MAWWERRASYGRGDGTSLTLIFSQRSSLLSQNFCDPVTLLWNQFSIQPVYRVICGWTVRRIHVWWSEHINSDHPFLSKTSEFIERENTQMDFHSCETEPFTKICDLQHSLLSESFSSFSFSDSFSSLTLSLLSLKNQRRGRFFTCFTGTHYYRRLLFQLLPLFCTLWSCFQAWNRPGFMCKCSTSQNHFCLWLYY